MYPPLSSPTHRYLTPNFKSSHRPFRFSSFTTTLSIMEDTKKGKQIPAFGSWNWNLYSDMPITQKYFQSATFFLGTEADDLFKVVHEPTRLHFQNHNKGTKGTVRKEADNKYKERKPKCMDKDLYEVPPELIYQVRKKKRLLRIFWTGCLNLNCIA